MTNALSDDRLNRPNISTIIKMNADKSTKAWFITRISIVFYEFGIRALWIYVSYESLSFIYW